MIVSLHSQTFFSRVVSTISDLSGAAFVAAGIVFLSSGSSILISQCGRAEEDRPLARSNKAMLRKVHGRERLLRSVHGHSRLIVSADRAAPHRLERHLLSAFGISSGSIFRVRIMSFNFGCNLPVSTSVMVSIHFLPGPRCMSRLHPLAKLSGPICSCIVGRPRARVFCGGFLSLLRCVVPNCGGRNGADIGVTVNYANKRRHSITLTREADLRLRDTKCRIGAARHSHGGHGRAIGQS